MSNDFIVPPHSSLSDANNYTNEIHKVFNQHWVNLNNERQASIDGIDKWHRDWKESIDKYANEQKVRINDHYDHLRSIFDEKYRENLETADSYYTAQKVDLFNELRGACESLKFEIATLKFSKYNVEHPEVIIVEEQLKTKNLEEKDIARRRRRLKKVNDDKMENNSGATASLQSNSTTSDSKQTECVCVLKRLFVVILLIFIFSDRQSSKIKPKRRSDQSTVNTDDSKNQVINDDQSDNKCPICFMIFPLNMTRDNRQQHVNEHYTDD
jgi:hypothetical protein